MQLKFNQMLIPRGRKITSSYSQSGNCMHSNWKKIRGSHLRCKVANKCLNVCEWMKVVERNKDNPSLFLSFCDLPVSVRKKETGKNTASQNAPSWIVDRVRKHASALFTGVIHLVRTQSFPICAYQGVRNLMTPH